MLFGISSLVFSVFYIIFVTHLFTIYTFELVGVKSEDKAEIIESLSRETSSKIIGIIPSNRIFSYRGLAFKKILADKLPNVSDIRIQVVGLHTVRISVKFYEPFLRIDDTHAITNEGVVYKEVRDIHGYVTLNLATTTQYKEEDNDGIKVVKVAGIDKEKLTSMITLADKINSTILTISRIEIDTYGDISLYDESGISKVMFAGDQDTKKVWSNLVSAIDTDPLKEKLSNNKDNLEYLDARFGNKVFYKFTNDTKTAIIQSHGTTTSATTTVSH